MLDLHNYTTTLQSLGIEKNFVFLYFFALIVFMRLLALINTRKYKLSKIFKIRKRTAAI